MKKVKGETEMETAVRNFTYQLAKASGVIWLVKKLPFLTLKPHYKLRDENPEVM